jgi:elongation factor G
MAGALFWGEQEMVLLRLGIVPLTKEDQARLALALPRLIAEDSSLSIRTGADGTAMIGAASEDQLDWVVNQLVHRFGVEAAITNAEIAYKETLTRPAEGESRYAKQSGGRGEYAHVKLRVEPGDAGSGCVFENAIVGGAIPQQMIPAVEAGVDDVIDCGVVAGYPIDDIRVTVYDGSYHDVDSSEAAFRIAARLAFVDGARRARPIVLEPIMRVSVVTPSAYESRVADGLRLRGAVLPSSSEPTDAAGTMTISTVVPLSQTFGYARDLTARTDRQGTFTMVFSHYAPASFGADEDDRAAGVPAPRRPRMPPRILRAAMPEPCE